MSKRAQLHTLERTSPKGEDFIGICILCGREGLQLNNMNDECDNPLSITQDAALLAVLQSTPEKKPNE